MSSERILLLAAVHGHLAQIAYLAKELNRDEQKTVLKDLKLMLKAVAKSEKPVSEEVSEDTPVSAGPAETQKIETISTESLRIRIPPEPETYESAPAPAAPVPTPPAPALTPRRSRSGTSLKKFNSDFNVWYSDVYLPSWKSNITTWRNIYDSLPRKKNAKRERNQFPTDAPINKIIARAVYSSYMKSPPLVSLLEHDDSLFQSLLNVS
jgi:hypothetical protein